MKRPTVIVLGAGFAGLTTAMCLAREGAKVKLYYVGNDDNAATPAAHGICTIKGILESDTARFEAQLRGHRGFDPWLRAWEEYLGRPRPDAVWIKGVGELFIGLKEFAGEFGRVYRKDFIGAKDVQWIQDNDKQFARTFYPGDFWIEPSYLVNIYKECCAKLGVVFVDRRVLRVSVNKSAAFVHCSDNFSDEASTVVICAGSGTARLGEDSAALPESLYAVAGYTFKATGDENDFCFVKKTTGFAVKNQVLHLGSTSDPSILLDDRQNIARWRSAGEESLLAEKLIKDSGADLITKCGRVHDKAFETRWGVRVRTRSRSPLIKKWLETDKGGVWLNTGYYKSGIVLSWMMAEGLSKEIISGSIDV